MRGTMLSIASVCVLLAGLFSATGDAQTSHAELTVAAAADLGSALREIGDAYEHKTGTRLKLSFGASGMLTQEIQNGAPFDVFLSADMDYPRQLVSSRDAVAASLARYARGKLVLWVPPDSHLDLESKGLSVLFDPTVKKIAIANPQHAPYGRAAVAALQHAGIYDPVKDRLVLGENVSQAAQFVESGNAQAGFVALAHARAPGMSGKGRYWEIPPADYPPLDQGVVILSHSQHKREAEDFVRYLESSDAAAVLQKYGFSK